MPLFLDDLETYLQLRQEACEVSQEKVSEFLSREYNVEYQRVLGQVALMLKDVLQNDPLQDHTDWESFCNDQGIEISGKEDAYLVGTQICRECNNLDEVKSVRNFYQERIIDNTEWLTCELKRIIQFINVKYEAQGGLV